MIGQLRATLLVEDGVEVRSRVRSPSKLKRKLQIGVPEKKHRNFAKNARSLLFSL